MNTSASAAPGSFETQAAAPAKFSATRPFRWSVRRELWENRSIYIAPLAAAAIFLIGFLISMIHLPRQMRALPAAAQHQAILMPYDFLAGLLMLTAMVVGLFYCLDALQGERRDRSILFWKSLPVSDTTTVLAKASIPLVVLPLITFALTVVVECMMLLLSSAMLVANGLSAGALWAQVPIFPMSLMLFYHLLMVHVLWHAPFYGWFLLVSAWARRVAILWAVLPLVAIAVVEKIAFHTSHFGNFLMYRLSGGGEAVTTAGEMPIHPGVHITPGHFLGSPGLWFGLAFTVICLAGAVRLRRLRGPI